MDFIRVSNLRELQRSTHMSDVAIACGKRSSNGPDQNTTKILPHQKSRRNNVSKHKLVDRLLPVYGEMTEEDKKNINEFSGLPFRTVPVVNLVGYKQNRKIWNGHAPKQRQIFKKHQIFKIDKFSKNA